MVIALIGLGAYPAAAAPPAGERITRCGQTITGATAYLARDLTCKTGFTLVGDSDSFEPAELTVDLRGHRLRGEGTGAGFSAIGDGLKPTSLTLTNGRIDHWDTAVYGAASSVTLNRVRLDHNMTAISCVKYSCEVDDSVIDHNETGGAVASGSLSFIRTAFTANRTGASATGSYAYVGVNQSVFVGNSIGISNGAPAESEVTDSVFTGNGVGFRGMGALATLTGNRFVANRDGVLVDPTEGPPNVSLGDNVAHHNKRHGIYAPGATDLGGNRAWRNGKPCVGVVCEGRG